MNMTSFVMGCLTGFIFAVLLLAGFLWWSVWQEQNYKSTMRETDYPMDRGEH